jgi:carboxyl-terminal processing protease
VKLATVEPSSVRAATSANGAPSLATIAAVAGIGALVAVPAWLALLSGWHYALAVLLGGASAVVFARWTWRALPEHRVGDRAAVAFAGTIAAALLTVYAFDWFDWHVLGLNDAAAGAIVGALLLTAGPARLAIRQAALAPCAAGCGLACLALVPVLGADLVASALDESLDRAGQYFLLQLPGAVVGIIAAAFGILFALRRGLYGIAAVLLGVLALVVFVLLDDARILLRVRLDWPAAALIAACLAWVLGAWFADRFRHARRFGVDSLRRLGLRAVLAGLFAAMAYTSLLLLYAAAGKLTGPMVLATLRDQGIFTVSDFTFSRALLRDQYLWREGLPSLRRIAAASPDAFIEAWRAERDHWSTAMLSSEYQRAEAPRTGGFGMMLRPDENNLFRVTFVFSGSPADRAGVRRGDVVLAINDFPLARLFQPAPAPGAAAASRPHDGTTIRLDLAGPDGEVRHVTVTRNEYATPAVAVRMVIDTELHKVGYVLLRHFLGEAGAEFQEAARRLRSSGVTDLILDLRMNGGGRLADAALVAGAVAGRMFDGRTFLQFSYNDRYRDLNRQSVLQAPAWGGLRLRRLIVITSEETCSAAEAVINGLAPHIEVITVGAKTCGKPVGMARVTYGEREYRVLTFSVANARGEGEYFAGLRPTCPAEDDATRDFGNPEEASLKAALHYVRSGRCPEPRPAAVRPT